MKRPLIIVTIVNIVFLFCLESMAKFSPAKIFSENMVLQREMKIPVWGKAIPGEIITVSLGEKIVSSTTNSHGQWKVFLPKHKAGGPFTMKIVTKSDTIIYRNILVGDVWFTSGQSNMEHPMQGWEWIPHSSVDNYKEEIQDSNYPIIRLFHVSKFSSPIEQDDLTSGEWQTANPESVARFSSISWFFAKKLNTDLNIPIGIIHSSWGGTDISPWLDRESLELFKGTINLPQVPQNFNQTKWNAAVFTSIEKNRIRRNQISYAENSITEKITNIDYDDSLWHQINFPLESKNSGNVVWFRKKVIIPDENINQPLQLSLGFLNRQSQVFLNGTELGYFQYPKPVEIKIPNEILRHGENILTIRLAQPFGEVQTYGEKQLLFISNSDSSFHLSLDENWKMKSYLEPINKAEGVSLCNPSYLFNGMVAPIIPFGIKGFIWYQGESNAGRPLLYEKLFQQLIISWRRHWELGNLPFLFFQVSNIELSHRFETRNDSWCLLREAQQKALNLPNTGMVVTLDIGDPFDIHPKNKKEFAERLVKQAKQKEYGQKIISDGPYAKSYEIIGNSIVVNFRTEGRLTIKSEDIFNGFEIAGANGNYFSADVKIKGKKIIITSSNVKNPAAARYALNNNPKLSLYNSAGFPAAPFDTLKLPQKSR